MHIETLRMVIRDFALEDVDDLHEILGDEETMANLEPAYDFEKTQAFLGDFCIGKGCAYAAALKGSGKVIGYILLKPLGDALYEMGWVFNKNYWRQGYAYESCKGLLRYAFGQLGAHKVMAETIDTAKSVHLMEKLGMEREGVQREQTVDRFGNRADLYQYGILRGEEP